MHAQLHYEIARAETEERIRRAQRIRPPRKQRRPRPPGRSVWRPVLRLKRA